jgi:hypothetical protein
MHYLLFNSDVLISDGQSTQKLTKGPELREALRSIDKVRVCHVDVDVMLASAPGAYVDKKDSLLSQKFTAMYSNDYVTIDEAIDTNIFQVFGLRSEKVKEVYALIPSMQVDAFVPYGMAVRVFLKERQLDMTKPVVFVDDLGHEKLITVFDGLKFSRTRSITADQLQDLLPDVMRSHIDFNKKMGEFAGHQDKEDFGIVSNNRQLVDSIKLLEPGLAVDFLEGTYPAIEGLKSLDSQIKYRIHEEIILERQKQERRSRFKNLTFALAICLAGGIFSGFSQITCAFARHDLETQKVENLHLLDDLTELDQQIYRDYLNRSKSFDYSSAFFELSGILPSTYETSSFRFMAQGDHWLFDTYLLAQDDQLYEDIPRVKILKDAEIKNFFIKDHPGRYLKVVL